MEKIKNRNDFLRDLKKFSTKVKLDKTFMDKLKEHKYFKNTMQYIEEYDNEEMKKLFILLEFTRMRQSCETVANLLKESGQKDVAEELVKYNTSPGTLTFLDLNYEVEIPVEEAVIPMKGSGPYQMLRNPRGKFIIINNIPDLARQTERFKHIFKELYFIPESHNKKTVKQIKTILEEFSEDPNIASYDAFAFMIVTHGEDEKIFGFDACRNANDPKRDVEDCVKISEIVNCVHEICKRMENYAKPKIVIFDCCRIHAQKDTVDFAFESLGIEDTKFLDNDKTAEIQTKSSNEKVKVKFNFADIKWDNNNKNTFIVYACSEGEQSLYYSIHGMTAFGQSFSHAIARYACEEDLTGIISRTCDLMEQLKDKPNLDKIYSKPEFRMLHARRKIYLNVGHGNSAAP